MGFLIVNWLLSAIGLFTVAVALPGFRIFDYQSALIGAGSVGLLSALLATILRQVTGTPGLAAFGLLLVIVDTSLFRLSALLLPGFAMTGFVPAIVGALIVLVLNLAMFRVIHATRHPVLNAEQRS
jgi:putative membrane protein